MEIADALHDVALNPARYQRLAQSGSEWAQQFSLEGLRSALATLLSERWKLRPSEIGSMAPEGVN
jgi:hypothetical protein